MTRTEFEALVAEALDSLPEEFGRKLDNMEIVAEDWPTIDDLRTAKVGPGMTLFGLYRGVPLTKRGTYFGALPDKISIFAGPMLAAYGDNPLAIRTQVRKTVLHEIGHHFGMNEAEIQKAQG